MRGAASLHESALRYFRLLVLLPSASAVKRAALAQDKLTFRWRKGHLLRCVKIL